MQIQLLAILFSVLFIPFIASAQAEPVSAQQPAGCWLGQIDVEGVAGQLIFTQGDQLLLRFKAKDGKNIEVQEFSGHFKVKADTLLLTLDTKERYTQTASRRKTETLAPHVQHLVRIQNILSGTFVIGGVTYPATFYEGCD